MLYPFHAFSGCDVTSQFSGKGNMSAWKSWKAYPTATAVSCIQQHDIARAGEQAWTRSVPNEGSGDGETQPKVRVLLQHAIRCLHQASSWRNSLKPMNLEDLGWTRDDTGWRPVYIPY